MARDREVREGKSQEQFRNWFVDIIIRLFLDQYRKISPTKWKRLVLAIQLHEAEARLGIILFSSVLNKMVQLLPLEHIPLLSRVADVVKGESKEVAEQLTSSFVLYARGQHVVLEQGEAEVKETDVKGMFSEFLTWCEEAVMDMKDNMLRMVFFMLPFFEDIHVSRDRHLVVVAGLEQEQWTRWATRIAGLNDSDRGAVMRILKPLCNPELVDKLNGLPDDQFMKVVRVYAGKGVVGTADEITANLANLLTDISTQVSVWTTQKRTEFDARRDELEF